MNSERPNANEDPAHAEAAKARAQQWKVSPEQLPSTLRPALEAPRKSSNSTVRQPRML